MTIPDLLTLTLARIHKQFYTGRQNDFFRDQRALVKAIARYGYECAQRNWHIEPRAIYQDIHKLLTSIAGRRTEFEYLPVYLDEAVRSHVNRRAEEISELSRSQAVNRKVRQVMRDTQLVAQVEPTSVDVLGQLFTQIKRPGFKPKPKPVIEQYEFSL